MIGLLQLVIVVAAGVGAYLGVSTACEHLEAAGYLRQDVDRPMMLGGFFGVAAAMLAWAAVSALFGKKKTPEDEAPDS